MHCSHCKRKIDNVKVYPAYGRDTCRMCDVLLSGTDPLPAQTPSAWPILSDAMGVHPDQIPQAHERNRRHGIAVSYTPDGRAILPDRGARRDLMKLEGFHDNVGGYGD